MIQKVYSLFRNVFLLKRHVCLQAFVNRNNGSIIHGNWGDDLNFFFLSEICKNRVLIYDHLSIATRFKLKNYLVIGSTIDMLCKENTEVWGAGIMHGSQRLKMKPKKVYAVRGPLTRAVLLENGVECPEVFGDPALLIPKYYRPQIQKKFKYGLIIHDFNENGYNDITADGQLVSERDDFRRIDLSKYDKWTDIIDEMLSCENIISYSLHGLIVAEAYGIPNVWAEFYEQLYGGYFKFRDFFQSIGQKRESPIHVLNNKMDMKLIDDALSQWKAGKINLQPLLEACPFEIVQPLYD